MSDESPTVEDVLAFDASGLDALTSPVLVAGLTGWFDVAGVATTALDMLAPVDIALTVGEIDPDPFYDFTQERPQVELSELGERHVTWPANSFDVVRTGGTHDLVVLRGVEPHLAWRTYAHCVLHVVRELGCAAVVTVGATPDAVPHTRLPVVVGSTSDPELAARLALSAPSYQGITGLVGVLHAEFEALDVPTISLRVGVPHYLPHAEHPQAVAALLRHLAHVLGVPVKVDLSDQIGRWEAIHEEVVHDDDRLRTYVRVLEAEYDRKAEAALRAADDLATRFEEFLRAQDPPEDTD